MFLYFSSKGERIIEFDVKLCSSGPLQGGQDWEDSLWAGLKVQSHEGIVEGVD